MHRRDVARSALERTSNLIRNYLERFAALCPRHLDFGQGNIIELVGELDESAITSRLHRVDYRGSRALDLEAWFDRSLQQCSKSRRRELRKRSAPP
jgi:hypothetical protein